MTEIITLADGRKAQVIEKTQDARPGDFLERLGWKRDGGPPNMWAGVHLDVVYDIVDKGLDRILRLVPEPQVWYGTLYRVGNLDSSEWTTRGSVPVQNGTYSGKLWPEGTLEPVPDWVRKELEEIADPANQVKVVARIHAILNRDLVVKQ